jgi:hypothetical protein
MRHTPLALLLPAAIATLVVPHAGFAQTAPQTSRPEARYVVVPLHGGTANEARISAATATTISMWSYSVTSPLDNNTYSGTMVGRSPFFHGARTTNIPTVLVPVEIVMPDGGVFDSTAADPACLPPPSGNTAVALVQGSPVLQTATYTLAGTIVGTTQYPDAFQRSNFWTNVSVTGDRYHTMLSPVTTLAKVTVNVATGSGKTYASSAYGGCGPIGVMDINWWQPYVETTLIPSLSAVSPTILPIFVFYNVVMNQGSVSLTGGNCCILGYHSAFGGPVQTYSVADFDTTTAFGPTDAAISALSHEVAEWMDDPLGSNATPAWGHTGQVTGCQNDLEVGDPLSGTFFPSLAMPNGVTYTPQELAFFSWFYRQSPSIGLHGWYSDNGTFTTGAGAVCM